MSKNKKTSNFEEKSFSGSKTAKKKSIKKHVDESSENDVKTVKIVSKHTKGSSKKHHEDNIDDSSEVDSKTIKKHSKGSSKKHHDDNIDFEEKIQQVREELKENYQKQKKLMNDLRELLCIHKKEIKLSSKNGNRNGNAGKLSGFNKPENIPSSLKKLLKIKENMLPRSKITKLMYQYFTDNKMYNTKTKKEIIPNEEIKKIFKMKEEDVINFYNLQTWLKKVYNSDAKNHS